MDLEQAASDGGQKEVIFGPGHAEEALPALPDPRHPDKPGRFSAFKPFEWLRQGGRRRRLPPLWRKVCLRAGDALFLPAGWWHAVRSRPGTVGVGIELK